MIKLNEHIYLSTMMVLAPLSNFISGIAIDLYAPSMPAIAISFHTSEQAIQNTVSIFVMGWALGCLFWGIFFDLYGRKKIILIALSIFVIVSLVAIHCHNIYQLMLIRFIQGITTAATSVGSRALIADHFTGHRFNISILNISIVYGVGTIIGPFIGGYLQHNFGWQANFYIFFIFGMALLLPVGLLVQERFKKPVGSRLHEMATFYKILLTNKKYIFGCMIVGIAQIELFIYPTVAPFLVEHSLNYSAITYGNSALIVGLGYLVGAMKNRFLLNFFSQKNLIHIGFFIIFLSLFLQLIFILFKQFNLLTLVLPITLICFGNGFIFGNIISNCIRLFKDNAGMATALQISILMTLSAIGVFLISSFIISSLANLFLIFSLALVIKVSLYFFGFKKIFEDKIPIPEPLVLGITYTHRYVIIF